MHLVVFESVLRERQQQNEQPLQKPSTWKPFFVNEIGVERRGRLLYILVFSTRDVIPRVHVPIPRQIVSCLLRDGVH